MPEPWVFTDLVEALQSAFEQMRAGAMDIDWRGPRTEWSQLLATCVGVPDIFADRDRYATELEVLITAALQLGMEQGHRITMQRVELERFADQCRDVLRGSGG